MLIYAFNSERERKSSRAQPDGDVLEMSKKTKLEFLFSYFVGESAGTYRGERARGGKKKRSESDCCSLTRDEARSPHDRTLNHDCAQNDSYKSNNV